MFPPITNEIIFRASAVLPAAGAWDAAPLEIAVPSKSRMTLYISYTRGAAGGAMDFQVVVSPYSATRAGVQNWFMQSQYDSAALVAGADSQGRVQREYITYGSIGAAIENFVYGSVELDAGVERVRVQARESGVVATPGICHIVGIVYDI
ncbi:MAG: hypothetical protein A2029_01530 [Chloroflexi bacterium RBG_19FT_COMBO_47_9]|nr:MAG: hypothetical protein A2029_01530 [Chloroflexi bacterium RBG_19FT_COMBO_47_9]